MHKLVFLSAVVLSALGGSFGCSVYDASPLVPDGGSSGAGLGGAGAGSTGGAGGSDVTTGSTGGAGGSSGANLDSGTSGSGGASGLAGSGGATGSADATGSGGTPGSSDAAGAGGADARDSDGTAGRGGAPSADAGTDVAGETGEAGPIDANDDTIDANDDTSDGNTVDGANDGKTLDGASDGDTLDGAREAGDTGSADGAGGSHDGGIDPTSAPAVRIIAMHSDKCMGVDADGTADGTRIYQFTCAAATGQVFRFESLGGATYRIINQSSGKCLSATGTGNGAAIYISACNGGVTQAYTLQPAGANYNIINPGGGNCVEVALQSTSDGAVCRYYTCNGDSNQVFRFEAP